MRRIIYHSTAIQPMDRGELFRLVYHARVANLREGLCGFLLYSDQRFLQVLEGDPWKVSATFARIRGDVRHTAVEVLEERLISAPLFARWRMRSFHDEGAAEALAAIAEEAGRSVPEVLDQAVRAFFGGDLASPVSRQRGQRA